MKAKRIVMVWILAILLGSSVAQAFVGAGCDMPCCRAALTKRSCCSSGPTLAPKNSSACHCRLVPATTANAPCALSASVPSQVGADLCLCACVIIRIELDSASPVLLSAGDSSPPGRWTPGSGFGRAPPSLL